MVELVKIRKKTKDNLLRRQVKMKKKGIFNIITLSVSLIILTVVFYIVVKNNNLSSGRDCEKTIYTEPVSEAIASDVTYDIKNNEYAVTDTPDNNGLDITDEHDDISIEENDTDEAAIDEAYTDKIGMDDTYIEESDLNETNTEDEAEIITQDIYDTITISAAGDVTLGRDENFGWERTFDHELKKQNGDYGYFFRNVKGIFEADDLTIVNLETTLTTATKKADKKFRFKADPSYVEILKQGNIEAVSIANNHTLDYLEKGYEDTLETLEKAGIGYFGYEHKYITQVRDIKIGVLGYYCMKITDKQKDDIKNAIDELKSQDTDLVIIMFHWGIERDYWPNSTQKELAYYSIDNGADLVLGAHPHVIQGIEEYKGKQIVYSLANFCFGGNKNPKDKDTMIYIQRFNFKNGELISQEYEVIPCSLSSVSNRNNYQPTPLEGKEAERVMNKIKKYSDF
jgi:poly-gamma-glutamate synthesis protein (capsule biosynthesis protein)